MTGAAGTRGATDRVRNSVPASEHAARFLFLRAAFLSRSDRLDAHHGCRRGGHRPANQPERIPPWHGGRQNPRQIVDKVIHKSLFGVGRYHETAEVVSQKRRVRSSMSQHRCEMSVAEGRLPFRFPLSAELAALKGPRRRSA